MDQKRIDLITAKVIAKINRNTSKLDLSSAFDCAGFGPGSPEDAKDPVWGAYDITGIAEFKKWLNEQQDLDLEYGTPAKAAATTYRFILDANQEFSDYWDCH